MNAHDLLDAARHLVTVRNGRPKQANLLRAISTTYYALFHALARNCADLLIGGQNADRSRHAWTQVYRALDHNFAKASCKDGKMLHFPQEIQDFASMFVTMQEKRHRADYDPTEKALKSAVLADIEAATLVLQDLDKCSAKDRRAFAAFVVIKSRKL